MISTNTNTRPASTYYELDFGDDERGTRWCSPSVTAWAGTKVVPSLNPTQIIHALADYARRGDHGWRAEATQKFEAIAGIIARDVIDLDTHEVDPDFGICLEFEQWEMVLDAVAWVEWKSPAIFDADQAADIYGWLCDEIEEAIATS